MGAPTPSPFYPPVPRTKLLVMTLITEGGLLVLAVVFGLLSATAFWQSANPGLAPLATGTAIGLVLAPLVVGLVDAPLGFTAGLRRDVDRLAGVFHHATLLDLLIISLLAGAGEEALFRGFLQPWLAEYVGIPAAIALVSIVFGLLHCLSRSYVVFATLLGILFGVLAAWADNIAVPMAAHAAYDFALLIYGVHFRRKGGFS